MNDITANLLDMNLDELADLPEFVVPPAGAYQATLLSFESKKIGDHPAIELKVRFDVVEELADKTEAAPAVGTESSVSYMLDNEFGVGALKALLKPLAAHFSTATANETMAASKGAQVLLVTTVRKGKKGTDAEDKRYLGISKIAVL
jgi:Cys-tRNA synthase (O-phospho-L-seryl-tRNA:Cys-tRNA synthase)